MSDRLFWIIMALLGAFALHFAYVLFMPGLEMGHIINRFAAERGQNGIAVLNPEEARDYFKADLPEMQTAACVFDAADGPVTVDAAIPASYWMIRVYSGNGELLFTLDDRQAGLDRMRFVLAKPGSDAGPASPDTIRVESPDARGLVLLQARASEPAYGPRLRDALANSTCGPRR